MLVVYSVKITSIVGNMNKKIAVSFVVMFLILSTIAVAAVTYKHGELTITDSDANKLGVIEDIFTPGFVEITRDPVEEGSKTVRGHFLDTCMRVSTEEEKQTQIKEIIDSIESSREGGLNDRERKTFENYYNQFKYFRADENGEYVLENYIRKLDLSKEKDRKQVENYGTHYPAKALVQCGMGCKTTEVTLPACPEGFTCMYTNANQVDKADNLEDVRFVHGNIESFEDEKSVKAGHCIK
ncbi:MAG: hypothetical protein HYS32_00315 [Candidatus Woesearchaeota archaeon]|nr:MAG: hypothetical protein HYS32_00315 [Candidatus Woesearchaeota archaeon]